MNRIIIAVIIVLLAVNLSFAQRKTFTIEERWVGKVHQVELFEDNYIFIATDKFVDKDSLSSKYYIVSNSFTDGPFDDFPNLISGIFYYSSKDVRTVISYRYEINDKYMVKYRNNIFGPFDDAYNFRYSTTMDFFVYNANLDLMDYIICNDRKFGPFDHAGDLYLSNDEKHFAFYGKHKNGYYIFNGIDSIGPYEEVRYFTYLSDNKTLAYFAKLQGRWYLFKGNDKNDPYDEILDIHFLIENDEFIYSFGIDNKYFVKRKNFISEAYDRLGYWDLQLSNYMKILSYKAIINGKYFVISNNEKYGPFDDVSEISYKTEKNILTIVFQENSVEYIRFGEQKYGPFDYVSRPIGNPFSNEQIFAYHVKINNQHFVLSEYELLGPFDKVEHLILSSDIPVFAFRGIINDSVFVVTNNNVSYGPYNDVSQLIFSLDSKYIGYIATINDIKFIFVNEKRLITGKDISLSIFSKDNKFLGFWDNGEIKGKILNLETNKTYIGSLYKDGVVYIDGNQIIIEPYGK